ncbi:MAG: hypothetical protein KAR54_02010 [Candidatus Pacebacteria bacterium]|nr:hypothetical protein [Candidatus Paceibacterota bacterium]
MGTRFRSDIDDIMVCIGHFQQFDQGEEINKILSTDQNLQPGDLVNWYCGQFSGLLEVVECENPSGSQQFVTIKKIN